MRNKLIYLLILIAAFDTKAQIFSSKNVISSMINNPEVVISADFNDDGYMDVIFSTISDHKVVLNLYNPITSSFDEGQIITTSFNYAVSMFSADMDGDGDNDFLIVSQVNNEVAWFKNDGNGNFSLQTLIDDDAQGATSVIAVDLDNDIDMDVVAVVKSTNEIRWYENDGSGSFSAPNEITVTAEIPVVVISADIDNDNDQDIIAGYAQTDKIVSFRNNGDGTFDSAVEITNQTDYIFSLRAADINGDGNIDLVSASRNDNKIAWYDNSQGDGNFSEQILISGEVSQAYCVELADFDLDNDVDVICSAQGSDEIIMFQNIDGNGTFIQQLIFPDETKNPKGISVNDFDNDGDIDIVAALSDNDPDEVAWFENGKATFVLHNINLLRDVSIVAIYDIDNDGNNDIFYSDGSYVCLVKNQNSGQSFGNEIVLYTDGANIYDIQLVDIDNDNDVDLFISDALGDKILWMENTDGNGNFSSPIMIDQTIDSPVDIDFADVDNDTDLDMIAASASDNQIVLYENMDGLGSFNKTVLQSGLDMKSFCFTDFDNDNNKDIVYSATEHTGYLKNNGDGSFAGSEIISNSLAYASHMYSYDLNNDDYEDIIFNPDISLYWLENNQDNSFQDHFIEIWGSIDNLDAGDLDQDGDLELVVACRSVGMVYYAENLDYGDNFRVDLPILIDDPKVVKVANINNDDYNDLVIGTWPSETLNWAENYQFRILNQPFDQSVCLGNIAYLSVVTTGVKAYQWQVNTASGYSNLTGDNEYSNTNKAQLRINSVSSELYANEYRCLVFDKNNDTLISESATLIPVLSSIQCVENQSRIVDNSNTYTVIGNEFDIDTIYNPCDEPLIIENDYNNTATLEGEVFSPGTYTIQWQIKDVNNQLIDNCSFDVSISGNLTYSLTFFVHNQDNEPLEGALIEINEESNYTDENGDATFDLVEGEISYTAIYDGNEITDTYMVTNEANQLIDLEFIVGSIDNPEAKKLVIFPNPSEGVFTINLPLPLENRELKITNISGKEIHNYKLKNNNTIDISNQAAGVYFIKLNNSYGIIIKK